MKVKEKKAILTENSTFKREDHGIWSHHFMANRWENSRNGGRLYFGGAPKSLQMVTTAMKLKDLAPWKKSYDQSLVGDP